MYGVNAGVPKTLVRSIIEWWMDRTADNDVRGALSSILATPISPELLPPTSDGGIVQRTEEVLGPYVVHDFFLYNFVRWGYSAEKVLVLAQWAFEGTYTKGELSRWLDTFVERFFGNQFKRSCLPDGPKIGSIALSPRADWRMPSDANPTAWKRLFL
jgi:NAD+ synthase (glutamine-hydrolysing)